MHTQNSKPPASHLRPCRRRLLQQAQQFCPQGGILAGQPLLKHALCIIITLAALLH